jgi:hypothetical protein
MIHCCTALGFAAEARNPFGRGPRLCDDHIQVLRILMLQTAIALIVGFARGYGVREWVFRQDRRKRRRRHYLIEVSHAGRFMRNLWRAPGVSPMQSSPSW